MNSELNKRVKECEDKITSVILFYKMMFNALPNSTQYLIFQKEISSDIDDICKMLDDVNSDNISTIEERINKYYNVHKTKNYDLLPVGLKESSNNTWEIETEIKIGEGQITEQERKEMLTECLIRTGEMDKMVAQLQIETGLPFKIINTKGETK